MKRYKINLFLQDREDRADLTIHYETSDPKLIIRDLRAKADLLEKTGLVVEDMPF